MEQNQGSERLVTSPTTILIVDDDASVRKLLREIFLSDGYELLTAADGPSAIRAFTDTPVHVVVMDLKLPGMDGLEVMQRVAQIDPKIPTVLLTGQGTIDDAVRAMKAGAFDFITKPFKADAIRILVKKAVDYYQLRQENYLLRRAVRDQYRFDQLVGTSDSLRSVLQFVEKVADSDSTILIQGESGTGKELVARTLHFNSFRRDRPLVPVNCGAIPEALLESELFGHEKGAFTGALHTRIGRFEMAHGGTIFLDEVVEMPLPLQVKLLRVLQERCFERVGGTKTISVDVRVIAATNRDLDQAVQERLFRSDLYYRLNVIPVTIPPLRERQADIPLLIDHFVRQFNKTKHTALRGITPDALSHLMAYAWPGNIRELENLIERAVVLKKTGEIDISDLPDKVLQQVTSERRPVVEPTTLSDSGINLMKELEQYENHLIMVALQKAKGITSKAAQLLHVNRTTLVEKLKRKGLDAKAQGNDS